MSNHLLPISECEGAILHQVRNLIAVTAVDVTEVSMLHQQENDLAQRLHVTLFSDFFLPAAEFFKGTGLRLVFTGCLLLGLGLRGDRLQ